LQIAKTSSRDGLDRDEINVVLERQRVQLRLGA
jgi:hypothetical protein